MIRFYLFGADSFSYTKMNSIGELGRSGFIIKSSIPSVFYELKPNLDAYFKQARFKTNSHGLRDKESPYEKPPNTFRAVVIGGSYTMPAGVEIEDAFHSILEDRLNKESSGIKYEFINFGVGGYNLNHKIETLKLKALEYEPDLALLILDGGSIIARYWMQQIRSGPESEMHFFFDSFAYQLLLRNELLEPLFKKKKERRARKRGAGKGKRKSPPDPLNDLDIIYFPELKKISETHELPICVVMLSHRYEDLTKGRIYETLVKKHNLFYSNTVSVFKNTSFKDFAINPLDGHPNADAQKMFAEVIYNDLKGHSLLGLRQR